MSNKFLELFIREELEKILLEQTNLKNEPDEATPETPAEPIDNTVANSDVSVTTPETPAEEIPTGEEEASGYISSDPSINTGTGDVPAETDPSMDAAMTTGTNQYSLSGGSGRGGFSGGDEMDPAGGDSTSPGTLEPANQEPNASEEQRKQDDPYQFITDKALEIVNNKTDIPAQYIVNYLKFLIQNTFSDYEQVKPLFTALINTKNTILIDAAKKLKLFIG